MDSVDLDDLDLDVDIEGNLVSVTSLNNEISTVIEVSDSLAFDYLVGDVSDEWESEGTLFFDLVDDGASIRCLAFSSTRQRLPDFEEGDRIAVKGRLNYWEQQGNCSIYVDDAVPLGDSLYHQQIAELRKTLKEEGLFDDDEKLDLPFLPTNVGIITAKGSDAEEDAINAIQNQFSGIDLYLCHSRVQGERAADDLFEAIVYFDQFPPIDLIVVTRGGGSERDFLPFNQEGVVRMISSTSTPVVTALGHENDKPIADQVADARAMTPTELGTVIAPNKSELHDTVSELDTRLKSSYEQSTTELLNQHRSRVQSIFRQTVSNQLLDLTNSVESAYQQSARLTVERLRNEVESEFRALKQQKRHERETADLQRREKLYKGAVIALIILFLCLILYLVFTSGL